MKPKPATGTNRQVNRPLLSYDLWNEAIKQRTARVGIVGMGYVGLPLIWALTSIRLRSRSSTQARATSSIFLHR